MIHYYMLSSPASPVVVMMQQEDDVNSADPDYYLKVRAQVRMWTAEARRALMFEVKFYHFILQRQFYYNVCFSI